MFFQETVELDSCQVPADKMVQAFRSDGFLSECTVTAKELAEMRAKHKLGLSKIKMGLTEDDAQQIVEKFIEDDERLNSPNDPFYLHSHCSIEEGEVEGDRLSEITVNGYRLVNATGKVLYISSSDGQCYEPDYQLQGGVVRNRLVEAVVIRKVMMYSTNYALEQEYASLTRLKAAVGLCDWKNKLLAALHARHVDKRMVASWFNPVKYTLQFVIELKDLKKHPIIYDPNTDLTFSIHSSAAAADSHPGHIIKRTRQVVKAYLKSVDENQSQVLRVVVKTATEDKFYQRINDVIQSVKPVVDSARPRVQETVAGEEILDEYVEIHVRAASSYVLDGATYRAVGIDNDVVLLHRYSLKEAMDKRILFTSPEHAKSLGDLDSMRDHERTVQLQQLAAEREREKNRYEENLRAINETKAKLEAELAREKQVSELHALKMKAQAEQAAREHEKQMNDLRKQMAEDVHRNSLKEEGLKLKTQESKSWTEGLKLVGAVVGLVAAGAVAVIKLLPKASSLVGLALSLFW